VARVKREPLPSHPRQFAFEGKLAAEVIVSGVADEGAEDKLEEHVVIPAWNWWRVLLQPWSNSKHIGWRGHNEKVGRPCVHVHGFNFRWVSKTKAVGSARTAAPSGRAQRFRIFLDTNAYSTLRFVQPEVHAGLFSFPHASGATAIAVPSSTDTGFSIS
jgi:hypothetical protein